MPSSTENQQPFALSPNAVSAFTGGSISRTRAFELIRTGQIDARKIGRRTVIIADSLRAYIERQPRSAAE
jgi:hypothetical protein